jgi:outer membrane protein assembly complex protein YaeT
MLVRWLLAAALATGCGVCAAGAPAQNDFLTAADPPAANALQPATPIIGEIEFVGLRRVSALALRAQIGSHEQARLDRQQVESDVRSLAQLGWFGEIKAETEPIRARDGKDDARIRLVFYLKENPFLAKIDFSGSRLLTREQMEKLLQGGNRRPRTGEPANDATIHRAAIAIRETLRELGHPQARIRIEREESPNATLRLIYAINDGPKITVGRVRFQGNFGLTEKELRAQMKEILPDGWIAGLRGKNVYIEQAFESDRARLLRYYADHGYPDARIGTARISNCEKLSRRWLPWPHRAKRTQQEVIIPVEAGTLYRFGEIEVDEELRRAASARREESALYGKELAGKPYSAQAVEQLRRAWFAQANPKPGRTNVTEFRGVDAARTFDAANGLARVRFDLSAEPPLIVERIEIRGLKKFKDRYVRRGLVLEEGKPLDERALEAGLTRLTRTGYFRPVKKEDVHVEVSEEKRTAKVTLQLHEIGQQRASLAGGQSAFGSTLGVVYSVFDLLNREELFSAQLEGGPQSALLALGMAKDGFLASNGSLAISVFDNVLRPRLAGSAKGPFYTSQSEGVQAGWGYAVTSRDALGVNYAITRNVTRYSLDVPESLTGILSSEVRVKTDSRSIGASWTHDSGRERRVLDGSVSGGWLGGNEHVLRSSAEYGRITSDPVFDRNNAWAFRVYASGAGSYSGDLPLSSRIFAGDELVRGLHAGELGPYAVSSSFDATGATKYTVVPAGSTLVTAANTEYRVPLRKGLQATGFFDLGTGLLLPRWLGPTRPKLLDGTNGVLHASTGVQLGWTVPGVQIPVRAYYALNVMRLNRVASLPDGTLFHAHDHLGAFGWAFGALF